MEIFTNEEFKVFCKKLEKELNTLFKIYDCEFKIEDFDDIEDEELKSICEDIKKLINESQDQDGKNLEDEFSKLNNKVREMICIDRMTDEQFAEFLDNEIFTDVFNETYDYEEYNKLSEKRKRIYSDKINLEEIKKKIKEGYFRGNDWENISENCQLENFQKIMELIENDTLKISVWSYSKENVQKEYFNDMIGRFEDDFSQQLQLWENTYPEIQKENFKFIIEKFEEKIDNQLSLIKETDPIVLKENSNYIFDMVEKIKTNIFEENEKKLEKKDNISELDKSKIVMNFTKLVKLWNCIGSELQNSEKGKKLFDDIWEKTTNHSLLIESSSEEFLKQHFSEILNKISEKNDGTYEIMSLKKKVPKETLIENFDRLYSYYTKGKEIDKEVFDKIRQIFKFNNDIVDRIYFDFLSKDGILKDFTDEQFFRITNYPNVQYFINKYCYSNEKNSALSESIKYLLSNDTNWIISLNTIIQTTSPEGKKSPYEELLRNISGVEISDITDDFKVQLLSVMSVNKNYFDIKNYEDVCNYTTIRTEVCEKILNGNLKDIPETLKNEFQDNKEDLYKFALLEHQFGISLNKANWIVNTYGADVKEFPKGIIKDYVLLLDEIINCENIESIVEKVKIQIQNGNFEPWFGSVDSRNIEGKILNLFEDLYNDVLYNPKNEEKKQIEVYVDKSGEKHEIDVYEIDDDFCMSYRVEGAYSHSVDDNIEDFKEYFEVPDMKNHGNCESFIRQDSISGARPPDNAVAVGYTKIEKNQLTMMAPYDIGSVNEDFSIYNNMPNYVITYHPQYRTPNQMIDHTRHPHNEIVKERFIVDENGNIIKLKPDFVVWIEETTFEERQHDKWKENMEQNKSWTRTKMLAAQLGIPIVIIDREKFAQKEYARIEVMKKLISDEDIKETEYQQFVEEYKNLSKPELIEQIMIKFGNNRTGIQFNTELRKKYFTLEQFKEVTEVINKSIDELSNNSLDLSTECLESFYNVCEKENRELEEPNEDDQLKQEYKDKKTLLAEELVRISGKLLKIRDNNPEEIKTNRLLQQYLDNGITSDYVVSTAEEMERYMKTQNEKDSRTSNFPDLNDD